MLRRERMRMKPAIITRGDHRRKESRKRGLMLFANATQLKGVQRHHSLLAVSKMVARSVEEVDSRELLADSNPCAPPKSIETRLVNNAKCGDHIEAECRVN